MTHAGHELLTSQALQQAGEGTQEIVKLITTMLNVCERWIQVMEKGNGFFSYGLKGMELQETSCHSLEATRLVDGVVMV